MAAGVITRRHFGSFAFSCVFSLAFIAGQFHTMPSKEEIIAAELDRVRRCNLEDGNLAAVVADYFALGDSEGSSDDIDVGKLFVDVSPGTRSSRTK